jgi:hypothetical protein
MFARSATCSALSFYSTYLEQIAGIISLLYTAEGIADKMG